MPLTTEPPRHPFYMLVFWIPQRGLRSVLGCSERVRNKQKKQQKKLKYYDGTTVHKQIHPISVELKFPEESYYGKNVLKDYWVGAEKSKTEYKNHKGRLRNTDLPAVKVIVLWIMSLYTLWKTFHVIWAAVSRYRKYSMYGMCVLGEATDSVQRAQSFQNKIPLCSVPFELIHSRVGVSSTTIGMWRNEKTGCLTAIEPRSDLRWSTFLSV